jgi:hypothetical protein
MSEKLVSVDEIMNAYDTEFIEVEVPEWTPAALKQEGKVKKIRLQVMSAKEAIDFTKLSQRQAKEGLEDDSLVRIIQICAVDGDGKKLFTAEQLEQIKTRSFKVLVRLQDEALKVNGFTKESARKIEEQVKKD